MEIRYTGSNKIRKRLNDLAGTALVGYALVGNSINLTTKTGHPSADIATGITQPSSLERHFADSISELGEYFHNITYKGGQK